MGLQIRIRTELTQTKSKPKFVNIRIKFKFLTLKIWNPNRSTESEPIYKYPSSKKKLYDKSLSTTYNKQSNKLFYSAHNANYYLASIVSDSIKGQWGGYTKRRPVIE